MIKLKNKYKNKSALLIMGGASIIKNKYDLGKLASMHDVTFLETKGLTPEFLNYNITPDYLLMFFPEKTYSNSLQNQFIQAKSSNYNLVNDLKEEFREEWFKFETNFDDILTEVNPTRPHKRFFYRPEKFFHDSPITLINKFPSMKIIVENDNYINHGKTLEFIQNEFLKFSSTKKIEQPNNIPSNFFDTQNNISYNEVDDLVVFNSLLDVINSSSMYLYLVLEFLGFKNCTIIGMDMSLIGSMEYSSEFTFKNMKTFKNFFKNCKHSFSYDFPRGIKKAIPIYIYRLLTQLLNIELSMENLKKNNEEFSYNSFGLIDEFMRTKRQIYELEQIFSFIGEKYTNIYDEYKYAVKLPIIKNISFNEFVSK